MLHTVFLFGSQSELVLKQEHIKTVDSFYHDPSHLMERSGCSKGFSSISSTWEDYEKFEFLAIFSWL